MPAETDQAKVGRVWRTAALSLVGLLVASWAFAAYLAYAVVDTGVSLSYCRSEQDHLKHDVQVLVRAGRGHLSLGTLVAARDEVDPELRGKIDDQQELQLRSVRLQFGQDGLLMGLAGPGR